MNMDATKVGAQLSLAKKSRSRSSRWDGNGPLARSNPIQREFRKKEASNLSIENPYIHQKLNGTESKRTPFWKLLELLDSQV